MFLLRGPQIVLVFCTKRQLRILIFYLKVYLSLRSLGGIRLRGLYTQVGRLK